MGDIRIEKLAEMLVNYSVEVKPRQTVLIRAGTPAEPLVRAVYQKVLEAGAFPLAMTSIPGLDEILYKYGNDEQLQHIPEPFKYIMTHYDVLIAIQASNNTKSLSRVNPEKMVIAQRAEGPMMQAFLERAGRGEVKWTGTLFPTNAFAQDAEMSLSEYEDFVYSACMPDLNDPAGYWRKVSAQQQRIVDWLKGKKRVHVIGRETDLRLSIEGRSFINCACHENVPDGEIFTGPVEDSAEGHVFFSYPTIYASREVTGVHLWFEKGKAVRAEATKNADFLLQTLDTDEGSRFLGEFAIGTNEGINRFTGQILYDEKIGGSFHMALGASYPETGGVNESAIHWDMICDLRDGGEIWVDDVLLYQNGKFVLDV